MTSLIPNITFEIANMVRGELEIERGSPNRIFKRMRQENPDLANIVDAFSENSKDPSNVLCCGAITYRLIEKAYESEKEKTPIVSPETCSGIWREIGNTGEEEQAYMSGIVGRIKINSPYLIEYLGSYSLQSKDRPHLVYVGLSTYWFIEKQALADIERETQIKIEIEEMTRGI
jgi:hypothetical protein